MSKLRVVPIVTMLFVALACDKKNEPTTPASDAKTEDEKPEAEAGAAAKKTEGDGAAKQDDKAVEAEKASCDGCKWVEGIPAEKQEELGISHHTPHPETSGCYRRGPDPSAPMNTMTEACEAKCCPGH